MSEDGLEPTTSEVVTDNKVEDLPDWAQAQIKSLRTEAAGRRVANREKDTELDEFRTWKEAQKSELERLTERALKAEQDLAGLRMDRMRTEAAAKAGLDPALADRIRGNSEAELLADAKELAERAGAKVPDTFVGRRGDPVRTEASTSDSFRAWINNN